MTTATERVVRQATHIDRVLPSWPSRGGPTMLRMIAVLLVSGSLASLATAQNDPVLKLSGFVRLRPQDQERALSATGKTMFFADEPLDTRVVIEFSSVAQKDSFTADFPVLVLQSREFPSAPWQDIRFYYDNSKPHARSAPAAAAPTGKPSTPISRVPEVSPRADHGATPNIILPQDPYGHPGPKTGPPFPSPKPIEQLSFGTPAIRLPVGTSVIRAVARRANGSSIESETLELDVRAAPAVLTLLAMGGWCVDADGNTHFTSLEDAKITRNEDVCAAKGVAPAFLADLTPMASVNCNDPCKHCVNFLEDLGLRILNTEGLADQMDDIDNPGTALCPEHRTNPDGIHNRVVFGKWRNTEEETVCPTTITFNKLIDEFLPNSGGSVILIGQSHGGAKLAGMVRDHWRWGDKLSLELITLWDATSFDTPMGVNRVGDKPKRVLTFFQYSGGPMQSGSPIDPAEHHAQLEQHDLDGCFSHNGIARSQFVHHRTAEVVRETLQALRDRARPSTELDPCQSVLDQIDSLRRELQERKSDLQSSGRPRNGARIAQLEKEYESRIAAKRRDYEHCQRQHGG
jgi:hypothetical protein